MVTSFSKTWSAVSSIHNSCIVFVWCPCPCQGGPRGFIWFGCIASAPFRPSIRCVSLQYSPISFSPLLHPLRHAFMLFASSVYTALVFLYLWWGVLPAPPTTVCAAGVYSIPLKTVYQLATATRLHCKVCVACKGPSRACVSCSTNKRLVQQPQNGRADIEGTSSRNAIMFGEAQVDRFVLFGPCTLLGGTLTV